MNVPIVSIWVSLPGSPVHFHQRSTLFQIGSMLGTPMKLDTTTNEVLRPSVARLCIEIDVYKDLPFRVYIQVSSRCISRSVVYEDLPLYCATCSRLGHLVPNCGKEQVDEHQPQPANPLPKPTKHQQEKAHPNRWTPKKLQQQTDDILHKADLLA